ncbi:unnamed protein product [Closterium sp. NIES-54]
MTLRPSYVPLQVPLPPPPESSLPTVLDPESDLARAASPAVSCLQATVVTDPSFESSAASALVAELVDFAAACRLDYSTSLVAESESDCPPSVRGECALGTDVLEERQEDLEEATAEVADTRATGAARTVATGDCSLRTTGVTGSVTNSELQEQRTHGRLAQQARWATGDCSLRTTGAAGDTTAASLQPPPLSHPPFHTPPAEPLGLLILHPLAPLGPLPHTHPPQRQLQQWETK